MMHAFSISGWLTGALLLASAAALAQPAGQSQQPSSALRYASPFRDPPVAITADRLELRDKLGQATFSGHVRLARGDTTITCDTLVVFYEAGAIARNGLQGSTKSTHTECRRDATRRADDQGAASP